MVLIQIKKHHGWDSPQSSEGVDLLSLSKRQFGKETDEYMHMLKALYKEQCTDYKIKFYV